MNHLAELTACYSNTAEPVRTEFGLDETLDFAAQLRVFASGARNGVHHPDVAAKLVTHSAQAITALKTHVELCEYFWFLFSQKAWRTLLDVAEAVPAPCGLPLHVADLIWLAFYRSQTAVIVSGTDKISFGQAAGALLELLKRLWPQALDRHALYAAMVQHIGGNFDESRQLFFDIKPNEALIEHLGGLKTVLPKHRSPRAAVPQLNSINKAAADHVTLVSLDRSYFGKYARQMAGKYFRTNPLNGLHFHCVGFNPSEAMTSWGFEGALGWTIDDADLSALTVRAKRGYYAAARYVYLPKYLDMYASVFVADVDGLMLRDIADVIAEHASDDIVLTTLALDQSRELSRLPWEAMAAGMFFARSTSAAKTFVSSVSTYLTDVIHGAISENTPLWYADQTALFYCWYDLQDEVRFARFRKPAFKQVGTWKLFQGDAERLSFLES